MGASRKIIKIGVTGAAGLIGKYWLQRRSRVAKEAFVCIVREIPKWSAQFEGIRWIQGDLMDYSICVDFVKDIDVLVHLAGASSPLTTRRSTADDLCANLLPTMNLTQAIRESGRRPQIVIASSGGQVYGRSESRVPWLEGDECRPVSLYGAHKLATEHYFRIVSDEIATRCTVLRISNVYGATLPPERMQGFLGTAVHELRRGKPVRVIGNITNIRDYIHLDDISRALDWAVLHRGNSFDILNVGSGIGYSVEHLIELLRKYWPKPFTVSYSPIDANTTSLIPWNVLDTRKCSIAGWSAEVPLEVGLGRLVQEV
jgi:UDP-glucose 4-epimerase